MDRNVAVRNVLIRTLAANASVAVAKILCGYLTNSIAMASDGLHSVFDGASNVIGLIGIRIASLPPDREHPYGHRKYETLFTLLIASMIFLTAYQVLKRVYGSFFEDYRITVTPISFIIMVATMAVNIAVMRYEARKGRELQSDFLTADAKHTRSDVFTSFSVIVGLILAKLGYGRADALVGIVIAVFIAGIGYGILKKASGALVDTVCIDTYKLESVVKGIAGVKECHDIRTRGTTSSIFVDLHVLVDPEISVEEGHRIASAVEEAVKKRFSQVVDIVVHIEPS